jgi:hypothetical protein
MKKSLMPVCGLCLALVLASAIALAAQGEKKGGTKSDVVRHSGRITTVSKDMMTVQTRNGSIQMKLDDDTKYTYRNQPGTINDAKEGRRVICLVKSGPKKEMVATRVDVREGK